MKPETRLKRRVPSGLVIGSSLVFLLGCALVFGLVFLFSARPATDQQIAAIRARDPAFDLEKTPPNADAPALDATQEALLQGYAWVDRGANIARIPIDRAMELVPTAIMDYAQQNTAEAPAPAATTESGDDIARPTNPGGAGPAINLTGDVPAGSQLFVANCQKCHGTNGQAGVVNFGSDDGTVPPLNPIDDTIISADSHVYAYNLDLFIEHGSTPSGTNPQLTMPAIGDEGRLSPQQIADVIAYIISLNPAPSAIATVEATTAPEISATVAPTAS